MNTYETGYELANRDLERFGPLHVLEKAGMLTGPVQQGYVEAIKETEYAALV